MVLSICASSSSVGPIWRCAKFMGASSAGPPGGLPDAVSRSPPLSPRPYAGSRAACPARSLLPERFRGCCPFGAPRLAARGLSRAVSSAHPRLPEAAAAAAHERPSVSRDRSYACCRRMGLGVPVGNVVDGAIHHPLWSLYGGRGPSTTRPALVVAEGGRGAWQSGTSGGRAAGP